jgi:excisionase family DNA binding protein
MAVSLGDRKTGKTHELQPKKALSSRGKTGQKMERVKEVMTLREASEYLGISPDTLYKYLSESKIPAFKLGNRWRFKKDLLDRWMEKKSEHTVLAAVSKSRRLIKTTTKV